MGKIISNKLIDMHTHTLYSDGDLSPEYLIKLAMEKGIGTLAITDHDTIQGIKTVDLSSSLIDDNDINIISGIELSAKVKRGRMHILGYDIDLNNYNLNKRLLDLKNTNMYYILSMIVQIKKDYGLSFEYEDLLALINEPHNLGRPDIAKLCLKYGYVKYFQEAFDKYLIDAHSKVGEYNRGINYEECIELIKDSDGIAVLAHPKSLDLNKKEFLELLKELIKCGLGGIEVYHSSHTKEEMDYYLDIARKYNLLISGGSDFHGKTVKPHIELGTGENNNIKIKQLSLLDEINKRRQVKKII